MASAPSSRQGVHIFSPPHDTFTRLANLFCYTSMNPQLQDSVFQDLVISDHSPVSVELENVVPTTWQFPSYLVQIGDFRHTVHNVYSKYIRDNVLQRDNSNLFWEAGKAFISGKMVSYVVSYRRNIEISRSQQLPLSCQEGLCL